ncbi:MAG: DUF2254 domain-containing protein [Saprospiraceae bacterium]|nr:DUF2254 domain-containing protein [Saprospiraceae bacterium]
MRSLSDTIFQTWRKISSSIAFYPAIISFLSILIAYLSIRLEWVGASSYLEEKFPILVVKNAETARVLLSTFISGIITLTVFSFTMVMVILNQAAGRYSPRLLPGLITDKTHQIVLGVYIGTIVYCTIVMRYIQPETAAYQLPGFSIMLAIIGTLTCIALFVFFIHNISLKIRVEYILNEIFIKNERSMLNLRDLQTEMPEAPLVPTLAAKIYYRESGALYFRSFHTGDLPRHDASEPEWIEVLPARGAFLHPEDALLLTSEKLKESIGEDTGSLFTFDQTPYESPNLNDGFRQVSEIITKAMSPGINDPGTALDAIDTLGKLLYIRLQLSDRWFETTGKNQYILIKHIKHFDDLLFDIMAPIRLYCKENVIVVTKLIRMLSFLEKHPDCSFTYRKIISNEKRALFEESKQTLQMEWDEKFLKKVYAANALDAS